MEPAGFHPKHDQKTFLFTTRKHTISIHFPPDMAALVLKPSQLQQLLQRTAMKLNHHPTRLYVLFWAIRTKVPSSISRNSLRILQHEFDIKRMCTACSTKGTKRPYIIQMLGLCPWTSEFSNPKKIQPCNLSRFLFTPCNTYVLMTHHLSSNGRVNTNVLEYEFSCKHLVAFNFLDWRNVIFPHFTRFRHGTLLPLLALQSGFALVRHASSGLLRGQTQWELQHLLSQPESWTSGSTFWQLEAVATCNIPRCWQADSLNVWWWGYSSKTWRDLMHV